MLYELVQAFDFSARSVATKERQRLRSNASACFFHTERRRREKEEGAHARSADKALNLKERGRVAGMNWRLKGHSISG